MWLVLYREQMRTLPKVWFMFCSSLIRGGDICLPFQGFLFSSIPLTLVKIGYKYLHHPYATRKLAYLSEDCSFLALLVLFYSCIGLHLYSELYFPIFSSKRASVMSNLWFDILIHKLFVIEKRSLIHAYAQLSLFGKQCTKRCKTEAGSPVI